MDHLKWRVPRVGGAYAPEWTWLIWPAVHLGYDCHPRQNHALANRCQGWPGYRIDRHHDHCSLDLSELYSEPCVRFYINRDR